MTTKSSAGHVSTSCDVAKSASREARELGIAFETDALVRLRLAAAGVLIGLANAIDCLNAAVHAR